MIGMGGVPADPVRPPYLGRVAATCAFVLVTASAPTSLARASDPPDVVVIVTDDQRAEALSWMPTVERELARKGVVFTDAVVPTSVCCPSRASILTGLYSHGTGVWSNSESPALGGWPAFHANGMEDETIATWLDPSYRTILVGKYLNHYDHAPEGYVPPGWNAWHAFYGPNGKYYDYELVHTDGSATTYGTMPGDYSTDVLASFAIDEIADTPTDEPLFLYFAPFAPHGPATPAPRHAAIPTDLAPYRPPSFNEWNRADKPPWIQDLGWVNPNDVERYRALQYRSLRAVDEAVSSILAALRQTGRLDGALIVFMSDNGTSWGEHRVPVADKFLPYDAASRVPLVMRYDGMLPPGGVDRRLALNIDVAATVAQAAGVVPPGIDGISLIDGRRTGTVVEAPENLLGQGNGLKFARPAYCGYRTKGYLFVRYASGDEELYAYLTDPWELENAIGLPALDGVVRRLRSRAVAGCVPRPPGFSW